MIYWQWGFVVFLLVEVMSIAILSSVIWWGWTLIVMATCFLLGITMLKKQGDNLRSLLMNWHNNQSGTFWILQIKSIGYISIASLLLISPGIFSDILALCLLLWSFGRPMACWSRCKLFNTIKSHSSNQPEDNIIEGKFAEVQRDNKPS